MMAMGVLIVDADAQRRQQLGTVLSFMGIPWQDVAEGDLDVAIESSGPLQGVLTGSLNGRADRIPPGAFPVAGGGRLPQQQLHRWQRRALYL